MILLYCRNTLKTLSSFLGLLLKAIFSFMVFLIYLYGIRFIISRELSRKLENDISTLEKTKKLSCKGGLFLL